MRILRRPAFLALPPGAVFMRYQPYAFTGLHIKGETWGNDFIEQDLIGCVEFNTTGDLVDRCKEMEKGHSAKTSFDVAGRDGLFESDDTLYAVYEPADVRKLIARLMEAVS